MFASIELLNLRHSKNSPLPARSPFLEQLTNQIIWRCKRPKVKSLRLLCPISFKIIYGPIANEVDSHKMRWRFFWAARREQKSLDTNRSRVSRAWKPSLHTRWCFWRACAGAFSRCISTQPKGTRVLAIDPSTRGFGFAVLEGLEKLVDWGVTRMIKTDDR